MGDLSKADRAAAMAREMFGAVIPDPIAPEGPRKPRRDGKAARAPEAPIEAAPAAEAPSEAEAAPALPAGFMIRRDGLFWQAPDDTDAAPLRVCGRLVALAETRDATGRAWGVLLSWLDREGRPHEWAMPRALLAGDGAEVRAHLLDAGLYLAPSRKARERLAEYLGAATGSGFVRVVPRLGWHESGGARVFVTPSGAIGAAGAERVMLQTERPDALPPMREAGTLREWQEAIAAPAIGNTRLGFAIGCALAAPLLALVGAEGGGFHLRGPSSVGKSTALAVAGSVWGGGGLRGWVRSWRTTDNALEAIAAGHCDLLICLDEMGECSPEAVAASAYSLANGAGKSRAARDGSARRAAEWRVLFLSTGEESLADRLSEARGGPKRARAGQEIRILDIPADTGAHGLFEALHGAPDARTLADTLKAAAARCYGTAGRAWLAALATDPEGMAAAAREVSQAFLAAHVPAGASGQAQRAAVRFALVAAAGEIAAGLGLLPWPAGEAERAAAACYGAWRGARQAGDGNAEEGAALAAVRRFLIAHGASRFEVVGMDDAPSGDRTINRAGWKKAGAEGVRFIIPGDVWRGEVVAGLDPEAAARACRRAGYLIPQSESEPRHVRKERIGSGTVKAYVIRDAIMGGEE
jgi:putative DNA primase/helicase